jgi:hypothetical protein
MFAADGTLSVVSLSEQIMNLPRWLTARARPGPAGWGALLAIALFLTGDTAARAGLIINPTYDPSVPTAARTAFQYAINEYSSLFTNNITINVNVTFGNTGLGSSNAFWEQSTYSAIRSALQAQAAANPTDTIKQTEVANLPATNPAPNNNYWITTAEAKALGLDTTYQGSDGTITFSNAVSYTYDPNNRAVAGEYDFIGVAEHEISEILGRSPGLGYTGFNGTPSYDVNDLFRYTNGSRNFTKNQSDPPGVYFSYDGGVTNLVNFYSQGSDNDDYRGDNPTDPYNQFTGSNQAHALNSVDIANMDVLGYNRPLDQSAAPEPASVTLVATGLICVAAFRARRRLRSAGTAARV